MQVKDNLLNKAPKSKGLKRAKIKGMLLVLNKIYQKFPYETGRFILSEANKIPNLNGSFSFVKENEIVFIPNSRKKVRAK